MSRLGDEHEQSYLESLRSQGLSVVAFDDDPSGIVDIDTRVAQTVEAMRSGADVIFQAWVGDTGSAGRTDFLRRVEIPSKLGAWSYEVEDTKLARTAKPSAVIQLCFYTRHLTPLQGVRPAEMHLVLGDGRRETFRFGHFEHYFNRLVEQYEAFLAEDTETYPWPCSHCQICPNAERCEQTRSDDDHLCLVAGMTRGQAERLHDAGVQTITDLASTSMLPEVAIGDHTLARLRLQAELQHGERSGGRHTYRLLEPALDTTNPEASRNLGLFGLPEPDDGDLFYDIEGYPHASDGTLDYLHGFWTRTGEFHAFWAHSYAEERSAFEAVVDFIAARKADHPEMHVYHYAPYERSALGRMMGRHATREAEVDDLFRGGVLVDLYAAVRNGVAVSQPSYSIKYLEPLYGFERAEHDLVRGDASIEAYHEAITTSDPSERSRLLQLIENYNRDDCHSTLRLHDWLLGLREEAIEVFGDLAVAEREDSTITSAQEDAEELAAITAELLLDGVPEDLEAHTPEHRARYLLAHLQSWHRREAKPEWWAHFRRLEAFKAADWQVLNDDTETLTELTWVRSDPPVGKSRTWTHTYRFDPAADHKFAVGDLAIALPSLSADPDKSPPSIKIDAIDNLQGELVFRRGQAAITGVQVLMPQSPIKTTGHRDALARLGAATLDTGLDATAPERVEHGLLARSLPAIAGVAPGDPVLPAGLDGDEIKAALADVASRLTNSCLPIQGPPGTGKTWGTSQAIVELVQRGFKIGVCGPSHKVIANLVKRTAQSADEHGVGPGALRIFQQCSDKSELADHPRVLQAGKKDSDIDTSLADASVVVAGTSWLFVRSEYAKKFDIVFIDEAGQVSLADALAIGQAAKNLVLVGDPQQLTRPMKGVHPPRVAVSALEHLLGDANTLPSHAGILLSETRRLHPAICSWTSERFYDGRLSAHPSTEAQVISGDDWLAGSGVRFLAVDHTGCRTRSRQEARVVAEVCEQLIGRTWTDNAGRVRTLREDDIVVIAPYNAHCTELAAAVTPGVTIGTVDRLQGQEGVVSIYSLAASNPDDVRRGHDFLYSPNRFNVATSRGRALSVVVGSSALLTPHPSKVSTMRDADHLASFATQQSSKR